MTKATTVHVRHWMLALMTRQASLDKEGERHNTKAAIDLSLPALKMRFPAEAFCAGSLDAIAGAERYWNEAAVTRGLEAWQRAHEPAAAALPPEVEAAPFDTAGKAWLAGYFKAEDDTAAMRALGVMRGQAEAPFGWLVRGDHRAASIVVRMGWPVPKTRQEMAEEWDDEAAVRHYARKIAMAPRGMFWRIIFDAFVQTIRVNAPQHAEASLDEMRMVLRGDEPVPVAFPEADAMGLF